MGSFLFWLLLAAAVLLFGRCGCGLFRWGGSGCGSYRYGPGTAPPEPAETPKQILDRRLAKGEITLDEYRKLLRELGGGV
ncbi:MAG: SHOCT domain-containing protein [Betaproteobacteria bacterium]